MTFSSIIFHLTYNIYTNIIDKICILFIVLYGGNIFYRKLYNDVKKYFYILLIILSFLVSIFLFFYGYFINQYCYDKEKNIGNICHFILHCLSSIGHHFIIFL